MIQGATVGTVRSTLGLIGRGRGVMSPIQLANSPAGRIAIFGLIGRIFR